MVARHLLQIFLPEDFIENGKLILIDCAVVRGHNAMLQAAAK